LIIKTRIDAYKIYHYIVGLKTALGVPLVIGCQDTDSAQPGELSDPLFCSAADFFDPDSFRRSRGTETDQIEGLGLDFLDAVNFFKHPVFELSRCTVAEPIEPPSDQIDIPNVILLLF
jgi:hypothetical protein